MATAKTPKSTAPITAPTAAKAAAPAPAAEEVKAVEAVAAATTETETETVVEHHAAAEPAFVEPIAVLVPAIALQHDVIYAALPGVEDLLNFSKANVEAVIAAGQHLALGLHQMTESLITWSQGSIEKSLATGQALAGVSSIEDAVVLSQKAAQQSLEDLLAEGNHLTSLSTKLLEEAFAPLQTRVKAAVDKMSNIAA